MQNIQDELKEDLNNMIYDLVSPNKKLCETVELLEKRSFKNEAYEPLLKSMQSVFMDNFKKALMISNKHCMDALDYSEWTIAADSFMLNKYDIVAKALEVRSLSEQNNNELPAFIIENIQNVEPVIDKLTTADFTDGMAKSKGLGMLVEVLSKNAGHSNEYVETVIDYAKGKIEKIKQLDVAETFEKNLSDSITYLNRVKEAKKEKKFGMR